MQRPVNADQTAHGMPDEIYFLIALLQISAQAGKGFRPFFSAAFAKMGNRTAVSGKQHADEINAFWNIFRQKAKLLGRPLNAMYENNDGFTV